MTADQDCLSHRGRAAGGEGEGQFAEQGDLRMSLTEGEEERKLRKTQNRYGYFFFFFFLI